MSDYIFIDFRSKELRKIFLYDYRFLVAEGLSEIACNIKKYIAQTTFKSFSVWLCVIKRDPAYHLLLLYTVNGQICWYLCNVSDQCDGWVGEEWMGRWPHQPQQHGQEEQQQEHHNINLPNAKLRLRRKISSIGRVTKRFVMLTKATEIKYQEKKIFKKKCSCEMWPKYLEC